ncbi:MAG: SufE family protein [Pseudomonadota bacterium]
MASTAFEEIVDTFDFLEDWEDRYRHVIELGKEMPPLRDAEKTAATKVDGCASQVWLVPVLDGQGADALISFRGDSDALIVKGLIAVLRALYDGQSADEILATDAIAEMGRIGLDQHLSSQRSNGLRAMIARVRAIAEQAKGAA